MSKVKCPKCGSEEFDCYDLNSYYDDGTHVEHCYCEECDTQFKIVYVVTSIEEE